MTNVVGSFIKRNKKICTLCNKCLSYCWDFSVAIGTMHAVGEFHR